MWIYNENRRQNNSNNGFTGHRRRFRLAALVNVVWPDGQVAARTRCVSRAWGYAAPVDVLMEIGYLSKKDYENWRYGRVSYLERVCMANLSKLSTVMHQMRVYAKKAGLKPSFCYYKQWGVKKKGGQGHKPVIPLRFSKSGDPEIERRYVTHFVDLKRVSQLKAAKKPEPPHQEGDSPEDGASNS